MLKFESEAKSEHGKKIQSSLKAAGATTTRINTNSNKNKSGKGKSHRQIEKNKNKKIKKMYKEIIMHLNCGLEWREKV